MNEDLTSQEVAHLTYFLGSKAENAPFLVESIQDIIQDYVHWRRNYFPADRPHLSIATKRSLLDAQDELSGHLTDLMAMLRRNFPFYSPRYLGHQLSDTTLPSMLGYFAAMLYNPNNVTPEAAPVTVDLEFEACNELLVMLGYNPPPRPMSNSENVAAYGERLKKQFGWAHISPGGTTANIEALWVARNVKYFPLSVQEVAQAENFALSVKLPNGSDHDIRTLDRYTLIGLKPNEAIYLLPKLIKMVRSKFPGAPASTRTWQLLNSAKSSLHGGSGLLHSEFPPVILTSGAAHYSVAKAAEVLGIGRGNLVLIPSDEFFRISVPKLQTSLMKALNDRKAVIAVVGMLGTTEEGACDPCHQIDDMRRDVELDHNHSFWLHIDAAWGGYIKSVMMFDKEDEFYCLANKCLETLSGRLNRSEDVLSALVNRLDQLIDELSRDVRVLDDRILSPNQECLASEDQARFAEEIVESSAAVTPENKELTRLQGVLVGVRAEVDAIRTTRDSRDYEAFERRLKSVMPSLLAFRSAYSPLATGASRWVTSTKVNVEDRVKWVRQVVSRSISIRVGSVEKRLELQWGNADVVRAFYATSAADSVTLDAHKMGYVPYPSGSVAFKNDRIRHLIAQRAPYITSVGLDSELYDHLPVKYRADSAPQAFAPFLLEGSRPGAAAAGLWMSVKALPLTTRRHGTVVRSSLLAARELYERLARWDGLCKHSGRDTDYRMVTLIPAPPDTNIVCFMIQRKNNTSSLSKMNALTQMVYDCFSIETELGPTQHSYSQPFFLSKTVMREPEYAWDSVRPLLTGDARCGLRGRVKEQYRKHGVVALRASVMSPYYLHDSGRYDNLLEEFVSVLGEACERCCEKL